MTIQRLSIEHPNYPPLLKEIYDPPKQLFVRGPLGFGPCVAVVGTRRMTEYGRQTVALLVPELVHFGFTVVSGLALGIDGAVHQETLDAGGRTVAVLGSGSDDRAIYPRQHLGLAGDILKAGGTILTEYPPGTQSYPMHFPARNRIVVGLCQAVLLIEGPEKSGAMITARLALESGREVWAVPGAITQENSRGPNRLIKDGAMPITCPEDIGLALGLEAPKKAPILLSPEEKTVVETMKNGPLASDDIGRKTRIPVAQLAIILTGLELKGAVASFGGSRYGLLH